MPAGRQTKKMGKTTAEDQVSVRCRCGWRLFDIDPDTEGTITAKCPRCKAVMAVTVKHKRISCTEQIAAHGKK